MNAKRNSQEKGERKASNPPLCREPWESYYILRRGIMPCCYGHAAIAPMSEWATTWNSAKLQEIRHYLSQGKLSPYCLECLGCPIVQRHLSKKKMESPSFNYLQKRPPILRFLNKLMFRIPGKLWQRTLSRKN
jgi:hypothetical protein